MAVRYARVALIWPIRVPGSGELRTEIDALADGVDIVREESGALVLSRAGDTVRIEKPELESASFIDGGGFARSHASPNGESLEREGENIVLYRPVGRAELELVTSTGWCAFPPRLPEQPIFYPVTNLAYATEIAERWNAAEGNGIHVLRFRVASEVVSRWFPVRCVGARHHTELWVPAEELDAFNAAIVPPIERVV